MVIAKACLMGNWRRENWNGYLGGGVEVIRGRKKLYGGLWGHLGSGHSAAYVG